VSSGSTLRKAEGRYGSHPSTCLISGARFTPPFSPEFRGGQRTISQSLALVWLPRVDGDFLVDDPQKLVEQGKVARIPFVTGDCDDEGTLFSITQLNVT
jgi:hypothetical protein